MTYEIYGTHASFEETAINDMGETVTVNHSQLLIRTESETVAAEVEKMAIRDGWTDIVIHKYNPDEYEKPDFTKVF